MEEQDVARENDTHEAPLNVSGSGSPHFGIELSERLARDVEQSELEDKIGESSSSTAIFVEEDSDEGTRNLLLAVVERLRKGTYATNRTSTGEIQQRFLIAAQPSPSLSTSTPDSWAGNAKLKGRILSAVTILFHRVVLCNPCCCCCIESCNLKANCLCIAVFELLAGLFSLAFGSGMLQFHFNGYLIGTETAEGFFKSIRTTFHMRGTKDELEMQIPEFFREVADPDLKEYYTNEMLYYKELVSMAGLCLVIAALALFMAMFIRHKIACWMSSGFAFLHVIFLWWSFIVYKTTIDRVTTVLEEFIFGSTGGGGNPDKYDKINYPSIRTFFISVHYGITKLAWVTLVLTIISLYWGFCTFNLAFQIHYEIEDIPHEGKCTRWYDRTRNFRKNKVAESDSTYSSSIRM